MDRHLSTVYVFSAMRSITQKNSNTVKRVLVLKEVVTISMFDNEGLTNVVSNVLIYAQQNATDCKCIVYWSTG